MEHLCVNGWVFKFVTKKKGWLTKSNFFLETDETLKFKFLILYIYNCQKKYILGEVSDSGSDGLSSDEDGFNDGYGPDLIGDAEDRKKLESMTEKEREQVLYERIERREAIKKR